MPRIKKTAKKLISNQEIIPYEPKPEVFEAEVVQDSKEISARSQDLSRIIDRAVTEQDWVDIFTTAAHIALQGGQVGVKWAEFLAKYKWGLPSQMVHHDGSVGLKVKVVEVVRNTKSISEEE